MQVTLTEAERIEITAALAEWDRVWADGFVGQPDAGRQAARAAVVQRCIDLAIDQFGEDRIVNGKAYDAEDKWFAREALIWLMHRAGV